MYLPLRGNNNYQKMIQTFTTYQPVHYCCPDKPTNSSYVSKNDSYQTQVYYHCGDDKTQTNKKNPHPTFKSLLFLLSGISAGIMCQTKNFGNGHFIYKDDTGSLRLLIPLQTIDMMARISPQLPSSAVCPQFLLVTTDIYPKKLQ